MQDEFAKKVKSTAEILGEGDARDLVHEIFADLHPGLTDEGCALADLFTPQSAAEFCTQLTNLERLLTEDDSYEITVQKIQGQIDKAEAMRDSLLSQISQQIRPIERTYRQLMLFFENSKIPDGRIRVPAELYVLNADPKAMKDVFSITLAACESFCRNRNDNFGFHDDICNLVVPGYLPRPLRERFEEIANGLGMLLITDTEDEKSFKNVERNFLPGGKYEFMKLPEDRGAANVVTTGYLQLRPRHWFESDVDGGDDLYGPPSLVFAGALVRTNDALGLAQGPVGSLFGQIVGSEKCRFEPLISEATHLSMDRQLILIIRDANNHLRFFGGRTQADDPYGILKFFTPYRVFRFLERCCTRYLLGVAGQILTRDFVEQQIELPLKRLLDEQVEQGTLIGYDLFVDKDSNKRMQGICDITLSVMPTGRGETFVLKIDVPEFRARRETE